ncbi:MAG: HEPN domain-containing protein [Anaerolineae bacterium]|nr:HEPN domain-containing protein [Candidatus Roseilinea sp.]MDW8450706.1 HEPN domain-containing protein [Anaerolineae bacterium]
MSVSGNRQMAMRWIETAEEDLHTARLLRDGGAHAPACFYAQQAAEKAMKALWYAVDQEPWGHSVVALVEDFVERNSLPNWMQWSDYAAQLDQFYIPTRYPDSLPTSTPGRMYRASDSERALACAEPIVNGCREWLEAR